MYVLLFFIVSIYECVESVEKEQKMRFHFNLNNFKRKPDCITLYTEKNYSTFNINLSLIQKTLYRHSKPYKIM